MAVASGEKMPRKTLAERVELRADDQWVTLAFCQV